jgi:hypothetical protein
MTDKQRTVRIDGLSRMLVGLPRIVRIGIAGLVAVMLVILIDRVFTPSYYTDSRTFTFLLSVAVGVLWYAWGWSALIGFAGDGRPPEVTRRLNLYVMLSVLLVVLSLFLLAVDVISGSQV